MTALENFLLVIELSDPGLYDKLDGDEARRELEALTENGSTIDGTVFVALNGVKQPLIDEYELRPWGKAEKDMQPIPVIVVEKK